MIKKIDAAAFVKDLKEAGVSISNESALCEILNASKDPEVTLEKICAKEERGITFSARKNNQCDGIVNTFKKHGFDGFAFRNFLTYLKVM